MQGALALGLCAIASGVLRAQVDNFNDGDDAGWTHYSAFGDTQYVLTNGTYRVVSTNEGKFSGDNYGARAFSYRSEEYTDTYVAVDLVGWDTAGNQAIGILFHATDIGPGTTMGYVLNYNTPVGGGGSRSLQINVILSDVPYATIAAATVHLEPDHQYRMVLKTVGVEITGMIYDLLDLTRPVVTVRVEHGFFPSGKNGVFVLARSPTTADATFDNYHAAAAQPASPAAPAIPTGVPGAAQVMDPRPVSDKNFHVASQGLQFRAVVGAPNQVDASKVRLLLNGADVTSRLTITGPATNLTVNYASLRTNMFYKAQAILETTGGVVTTHEWAFDTFVESYLFSSACKFIEAEDYNYEGGKYQNDPPPSGFNSVGAKVNGNGAGYLDQLGIANVDFFDYATAPASDASLYRIADPVGTSKGAVAYLYLKDNAAATLYTNDTVLARYGALDLPDYNVTKTEGGEWLNYSRSFAAGAYVPFLRASSYANQDVYLQEVTGDTATSNQTTNTVGVFRVANTGHQSIFRYHPLVDENGAWKTLNLSAGVKTYRLLMGGPREDATRLALLLNYMVFVPPQQVTVTPPALGAVQLSGGQLLFSCPSVLGATYRLQSKADLGAAGWQDGQSQAGTGGSLTFTNAVGAGARFFRVRAE